METTQPLWKTHPLTEQEIAQCESLLARAQPLPKMQWPILRAMWQHRLAPFNPIELVILRDTSIEYVEPSSVVLYRQRANKGSDQEKWPNAYHFPGSYLGGGEHIDEAIQRILHTEIAPNAVLNDRQLVSTTNLPHMVRNHDASLVFLVTLRTWPASFKMGVVCHQLDQPPSPLIPHHVDLQDRVLAWVRFIDQLRSAPTTIDVQDFLQVTDVLESDVE